MAGNTTLEARLHCRSSNHHSPWALPWRQASPSPQHRMHAVWPGGQGMHLSGWATAAAAPQGVDPQRHARPSPHFCASAS